METIDSLKRDNRVAVTIEGPEGNELYKTSGTGYHSLEAAIDSALNQAQLSVNPEDCVFVVNNETTGVTHRYRFNAHGNLKLIV